MSSVDSPATAHQATVIRPWDYVYLRTAPLAASQQTYGWGPCLGDAFGGIRYQHWALQIRHYVYDVARLNDNLNDNEFATYYLPLPVKKWENKRSEHGEKVSVGSSDLYIEDQALVIWAGIFRETYKLRVSNCQHFVIELLSIIHATTSQIRSVPPSALANLKPLPKPMFTPDKATAKSVSRLSNNQSATGATPETNGFPPMERNHYCGYQRTTVDVFSRMGYSVQDTIVLLQRLGVSRPSPQGVGVFVLDPTRLTLEKEKLLLCALDGEVELNEEGEIVSQSEEYGDFRLNIRGLTPELNEASE
ncbi:hypothetical protein K505DRAFT_333793 [Melanomma pulvis-pyrius CBS 109.77]|uniref:PPPDE domain-containing protein n=1 Tax=Melanomma pulvis-pyrius CBS 109.77 TaxID=1314802 RepID=A0A6A6XP17_9PLEO|nr:hypothetical protein K505DRAFT_333793 [Melanomma pulvis-pyrius CBS 109.77]